MPKRKCPNSGGLPSGCLHWVLSSTQSRTAFGVLFSISFCHLLNDMNQSMITALYPVLKTKFHLDFSQIGLITLVYQLTASLLQPVIGNLTDKRPTPWSLAMGMGFMLCGLLLWSTASTYEMLLVAAAMIGMGSAVFHPEAARVARTASGGKHGLAQSLFQVGGNAGTASGPLLAAFFVVPRGQESIAWLSVGAIAGIIIMWRVGVWYKAHLAERATRKAPPMQVAPLSPRLTLVSIGILVALIFSKYFYLASLSSYYTFYLMTRFHVNVRESQLYLFLFLGATALGTLIGGPVGDRIGRRYVIWGSILGVLPFSLLLPWVNLFWTAVLTVIIGLILSSAFSAILVYAQELVPGRVGMISGLFFGFAFGMAGIGAAVLGRLADHSGIVFVYRLCAFLPIIGLLTWFLPDLEKHRRAVL